MFDLSNNQQLRVDYILAFHIHKRNEKERTEGKRRKRRENGRRMQGVEDRVGGKNGFLN